MTEKNPFKLMSLEEAAKALGVDYRTVYRLVQRGEIPAGRVGRVYRVKEKDLHDYFERSTEAEAKSRQTPSYRTAAPVQTCGTCGKEMLSSLSVAGRCEVCGKPICAACWSVKKIRRCDDHAVGETSGKATPSPKTDQNSGEHPREHALTDEESSPSSKATELSGKRDDAKQPRAAKDEKAISKIDELRATGATAITYGETASLRDQFLRSFVQRVERLEYVQDHTSAEICVRDARARFVDPEFDEGAGLDGRGPQFFIRTGGWGKPRHCVVLEARMLGRFERLEATRYDDELLDQEHVSTALHALVKDKSAKPLRNAFRFVFLACVPGLAEDAASVVSDVDSMAGFYDKQILVALLDAKTEAVHYPRDDERYWPFLPLIDPSRWKEAVDEAVIRVEESVRARGSLSVDDAVRRLGVTKPIARAAFTRLAQQGMKVDDIEGIGQVLSVAQ